MAFRPIRLETYDDAIEFMTEKGSFIVPIYADIPTISSAVPTNLDFGFCPCVGHTRIACGCIMQL